MARILRTCKSHLELSRVCEYPYEFLSWARESPTCLKMKQVYEVSKKMLNGRDRPLTNEQGVEEIR